MTWYIASRVQNDNFSFLQDHLSGLAWFTLLQPIEMSHTRKVLCHNTHIICYTLQELSRYATAGIKLHKSHTSSVFRLEEEVGAMDTKSVPVLVFVCICVSLFRHAFPWICKCVLVCLCKLMSACVCQQSSPCLRQKSSLVHVERTWILSFSGLTLARPPLAKSRQQIRSWELPTGLVTGMWRRAGRLGCFTARMDHDRRGMLPVYGQNK